MSQYMPARNIPVKHDYACHDMDQGECSAKYFAMTNRLAEIRQSRALTQDHLAEMMDSGQPTISKHERSLEKTPLATIRRYAEALGVTVGDIVDLPRVSSDAALIAALFDALPERDQRSVRALMKSLAEDGERE